MDEQQREEKARWLISHYKGNWPARDAYLQRFAREQGREVALDVWERMQRIKREGEK